MRLGDGICSLLAAPAGGQNHEDKKLQETHSDFHRWCGERPDGKGSGFAWIREDTGVQHIERIDGLSNNEAEYRAVISALKPIKPDSNVEILTDSLLVVS